MHQRPLCIRSLTTKLLSQKHPYAQLLSRKPKPRVIQPSFFFSFLLQYNVTPTCLCCSVRLADDQLLKTLHPNTSARASNAHFLRLSHSAQSVPSSRFLAQTLFKSIVWCTKTTSFASGRGFQTLLSECTILLIISCSSVALSKCLQIVGQHRPTRVHTGRDAGFEFLWVMSKNPWHSSPCPQRRRLVHQLHSGRFLRHQVGCIMHHPHVMQSVLQ